MERDLYKQIKLAKTLEIKLKTEKNFRAEKKQKTKQNKKKNRKRKKKNCNKSAKLHFYYSTHENTMIQ